MPDERRKIDYLDDVEIPQEALDKLSRLKPVKVGGCNKRIFEPWEDKFILENWRKYPQMQICDILKCSGNTARARYRELIAERES